MKIQVTQSRIDSGVRGSCGQCPIALALDDATGRKWMVEGHYAQSGLRYVRLPAAAREFIWLFDKGFVCKPFEFDFPL